MDNRGKHWTMDHDQMLMENPQWGNAHFSQLMGRSILASNPILLEPYSSTFQVLNHGL